MDAVCLPFRPPLQLHSGVQPGHSALRAAGQSLIHPPPSFIFLQRSQNPCPKPGCTPLQGSDHLTGQREPGHPGASRAVDGDGHNGTHPARHEAGCRGTLDPHCPVLVHRAWASRRGWQPLLLVDSPSRKKKMGRCASSRGPFSSPVP